MCQVHLFVVFAKPEDILDTAPQLSGLIDARLKGDGVARLEHSVRGAVGQRQWGGAQQADAVTQRVLITAIQTAGQPHRGTDAVHTGSFCFLFYNACPLRQQQIRLIHHIQMPVIAVYSQTAGQQLFRIWWCNT